jgi:hypothetical protein
MTHSCHHPGKHVIPLEELARNPSALHNTRYKKEQRRKMLAGERPAECGYCWEAEDAGAAYSDRLIKSTDPWAWPHLETVRNRPWDADIQPTFLEVMLDDVCNFSCAYCIADSSTSIAAEMKTFGDYAVHIDNSARRSRRPALAGENPYLKAFWQWLPEVLPGLEVLRLTGGEPLLSPVFQDVLGYLRERRLPGLRLGVNSHFGHSTARMRDFVAQMRALMDGGHVGRLELYTSADTCGEAASYIRHGLDYARWLANVELAASALPDVPLIVMCTFNILSVSGFRGFLRDIHGLKSRHPQLLLDISSLRKPGYLRADIADAAALEDMAGSLAEMKSVGAPGFSKHEIAKMETVCRWAGRAGREADPKWRINRADFFRFIKEYDRRKKRDFLKTFPDRRELFLACKLEAFDGFWEICRTEPSGLVPTSGEDRS